MTPTPADGGVAPDFPSGAARSRCTFVPPGWPCASAPAPRGLLRASSDRQPRASAFRGTHLGSGVQQGALQFSSSRLGSREQSGRRPSAGSALKSGGTRLSALGASRLLFRLPRASVLAQFVLARLRGLRALLSCCVPCLPAHSVVQPGAGNLPTRAADHARGRALVHLRENAGVQPAGHVRRRRSGAQVLPARPDNT